MGAKSTFLDPLAGALGAAAGVGSFLLIPGAAAAIPAAIGIGALVYGAKLAVSALGSRRPADKPPVGAGADATAAPRVKRGSATETWQSRGAKAVRGIADLAAAAGTPPVIRGQLENVALEARDSLVVLDQLAEQSAGVEASLDRMPASSLRDQRARLAGASPPPGSPEAAELQRALDAVVAQQRTVDRLVAARAGLLARMESIVLGLEQLQSEMNETVAVSLAAGDEAGAGGEQHLRDLSDQLAGLRAGLEETRRYTAEVLGPQS
ncbi:hypothetical protein [Cumulibacter manganitolerans]|uniref:hypothetical protein n=1 Tax=Cumulibacter manganitolerans TaxID=1884992 RepID=UPI0012979989|nr:hypothetical protein [Cumulibacter manganitolerans]